MAKEKIKPQKMEKEAVIMLCVFFIPLAIISFVWFNGATVGTFFQMFQKVRGSFSG